MLVEIDPAGAQVHPSFLLHCLPTLNKSAPARRRETGLATKSMVIWTELKLFTPIPRVPRVTEARWEEMLVANVLVSISSSARF